MTKFGKYELFEALGRGGFGTVYRAQDTILEVERAVKVLHPALVADPEFLQRFAREAKLAARLEHPNIVPVYDLVEEQGMFLLVLKYMPGGSLKELLAKSGGLPYPRVVQILAQAAAGLDFAHEQKIVHRDIKPANVLFEANGTARISDFGFARALDGSASLSASGGMVGTPAYMAPEIWRNKPAGPATDVYSLGCMAYEMLTGQALFSGDSPADIMTKHVLDGAQFTETWPESTPDGVQAVLEKALERDPAKRYQIAGVLVDEMRKEGSKPEKEEQRKTEEPAEGPAEGQAEGQVSQPAVLPAARLEEEKPTRPLQITAETQPAVTEMLPARQVEGAPVPAVVESKIKQAAQPAPPTHDEAPVSLPKDAVLNAHREQAAPPVVPPAVTKPASVPPTALPAPLPHDEAPVTVAPAGPAPQPRSKKKTLLTVGWIVLALAVIFVIGLIIAVIPPPDYMVKHTSTSAAAAQPTATMAPAEPTATMAPAEPTATMAPAEPTATMAPAAPTATTAPPAADQSPTYGDWPMYGYDSKSTFWNINENTLKPPLKKVATYPVSGQPYVDAIVIASGVILVSGSESNQTNTLYAFNETDGNFLWKFKLPGGAGGAMTTAAAVLNGTVYIGGQGDTDLYSLDIHTGALNWKVSGMKNMYSRHPKIYQGRLYYNDESGIGALDPSTQTKFWTFSGEGFQSAMAVGDQILAVGGFGTPLTAASAESGQPLWKSTGMAGYQVTIDNGLVYVIYTGDEPQTIARNGYTDYVYDHAAAFRISDGSKVWDTHLPKETGFWGHMAAYDGILYVANNPDKGDLYAIDALTGNILTTRSNFLANSQMVGANNTLYVCTSSGKLAALDPKTLETTWSTAVGCGHLAIADGQLFMIDTSYNVQVYK
jgi:outer membrane protein assembly factor BamB